MPTILFHSLKAILAPVLDPSVHDFPIHVPRADVMVIVKMLYGYADKPDVLSMADWKHLLSSFFYICVGLVPPSILDEHIIHKALLRALCTSYDLTVICRYQGQDMNASAMARITCIYAELFEKLAYAHATNDEKTMFHSTLWKLGKEYISPYWKESILHVNCASTNLLILGMEEYQMHPTPAIFKLLLDHGADPLHRDILYKTPLQDLCEEFESEVASCPAGQISLTYREKVEGCAILLSEYSKEDSNQEPREGEKSLDEIIHIVRTRGRLDVSEASGGSDTESAQSDNQEA